MAEEAPLNLSTSSGVASRFVSSADLDAARDRRAQEWKELHEKLGQEAPPPPEEEYDPRSLYERLKSQRDSKQEAFEEKLKFKNQFRALDEEEVAFLDEVAQEKRAAERAREREIAEELGAFKKARAVASQRLEGSSSSVMATVASPPPPSTSALPAATTSTNASKPTAKPKAKGSLLGGAIKKKTGVKRKSLTSASADATEKTSAAPCLPRDVAESPTPKKPKV